MRTQSQITTMLNEVDHLIEKLDEGGDDSSEMTTISDTLVWVLESTTPDTRVTDYFPEIDDDDKDEDEDEDDDEE